MTEAKLLEVSDNAEKPRTHGRRGMDKIAYAMLDVQRIIKYAALIVSALSGFFLAAIGMGMTVEVAWQHWQTQHAQFKTPPALVKPQESK